MPTLGIVANQAFQAIPYVINRNDASDQYGNAERNATEKRVFAVGRSDVQSWGGSGVIETLTPTDARTEDRAMTIGQRVDFSTDTAWLGQLFYPSGYAWDGPGEWYFTSAQVQMLLTSTYLLKTAGNSNVAMTVPSLVYVGSTAGSHSTPQTFPATPTGLYTTNRIESVGSYPPALGFRRTIQYGWAGVVTNALAGALKGTYTRITYSGSVSSSETQSGRTLDYTASNSKDWDTRTQHSEILAQTLPYPSNPGGEGGEILLSGPPLSWESGRTVGSIGSTRGKTERVLIYDDIIFDSEVVTYYETQNGSFSVKIGSDSLVEGVYYLENVSGDQAVMVPNTDYYLSFLADPYGLIGVGSGMGIYSQTHITLSATFPNDIDPGTVNAEVDAMVAAYQGQICYDDESTSGYYERPEGYSAFYWREKVPVSSSSSSLSWSTKDYILYDETNGVYISVESSFVGVDTSATLDV
ncbi:hypothetical protein KC887_09800, partial [Candidatus Kaiserbacteria bacterium]|nr:hypothetical protein [Candidatus Kaiserbacteria bacterium]